MSSEFGQNGLSKAKSHEIALIRGRGHSVCGRGPKFFMHAHSVLTLIFPEILHPPLVCVCILCMYAVCSVHIFITLHEYASFPLAA